MEPARESRAPRIDGVAPDALRAGSAAVLAVSGEHLAESRIEAPAGLSARIITASDGLLELEVVTDEGLSPGARQILIANDDGAAGLDIEVLPPLPRLLARPRPVALDADGTYPIDYAYDADGLLIEASAEGSRLTLTRDAGNGVLAGTAVGSITTEHDYNAFGEPETYTALHGPDVLLETRYTRDPLGRITEIEETIVGPKPGDGAAARRAPPSTRTISYTYDAADRLQSWSIDGALQETYGYDDNGNRTLVNGEEVASYDDQDRLIAYTPTHPRPVPDAAIGYRIDPQNRRIARTENGEVSHLWVYRDDLNPIAELHPDGTLKNLWRARSPRTGDMAAPFSSRPSIGDGDASPLCAMLEIHQPRHTAQCGRCAVGALHGGCGGDPRLSPKRCRCLEVLRSIGIRHR